MFAQVKRESWCALHVEYPFRQGTCPVEAGEVSTVCHAQYRVRFYRFIGTVC